MKIGRDEYQALCKTAGFATRVERHSTEEGLHQTCIQWVTLQEQAHPILEWLIHAPKGKKVGRSGVPDLMLPFPSPRKIFMGLAIELKTPTSNPAEPQARWLKNCQAAGYLIATCHTIEEFELTTMKFLRA
jgi:hypothetical protein